MSTEVNNQILTNDSWEPESALDILIALLYSKGISNEVGEPLEGITRLDKLMFLLGKDDDFKEIIKKGYKFEADNFGPFAAELFDDIEALKHENIVKITSSRKPKNIVEIADEDELIGTEEEEDSLSDTEFSVNVYQLTERGLQIGHLIWNGLSDIQKLKLIKIKKLWQEKNLTDLLHYVYTKFPETIVKSKIKEHILNTR